MTQVSLAHIALTGSNAKPAVMNFGSDLTVIHGASDTGKSFVFDALNFMLGAKSIRHIVELDKYDHVFLGVRLIDGSEWTLSRSVQGGAFTLYGGLHSSNPGGEARVLGEKHSSESLNNLSQWLLGASGIGPRRVRKNVRNETVGLSFRDVARLCMVDEIDALSQTSPVESGNATTRTKDRSTFRLLLEDSDDASLGSVQSREEIRATASQLDAVARLLEGLLAEVESGAPRGDLQSQLERLNLAMSSTAEGAADDIRSLDEIRQNRSEVVIRLNRVTEELTSQQALLARFSLLQSAYDSDLARLDAVEETGSLLGFFSNDTCPYCGSTAGAWEHAHEEVHSLQQLVTTERLKVASLRSDLADTLDSIASSVAFQEAARAIFLDQLQRLDLEAAELEERVAPYRSALEEIVNARTQIERTLAKWEQLDTIIAFRDQLERDRDRDRATSPSTAVVLSALPDFEATLRHVLASWGVLEAEAARFDVATWDVVVGDRPRAERGAGMRALLHAAFTVSFAEFCLTNERPHPGFVVLDSPLVTYRDPESAVLDEGDTISGQVADAFYRFLGTEFSGQAIIIENTPPPDQGLGSAVVHSFTHSADVGRYGFFPLVP